MLLGIMIVAGAGCAPKNHGLIGRTIEESEVIDLKSNTAVKSEWKSTDLRLAYNAIKENNKLKMSGEGHFTKRIQSNFYFVKSFFVQVYYVDGQGNIIGSDNIASAVNNTERTIGFNRTLALPADTQALTFGYRGEVFSTDGKSLDSLRIFHFPN